MADSLRPVFDEPRMHVFENANSAFSRVLHIAHHEWHGIRHASAYSPGQKLLISADGQPTDDEMAQIALEIDRRQINRVVFQGYSENADALAVRLRTLLDPTVKLFAVTHVTPSQFDHFFEMIMQARIFMRHHRGVFERIGSVKPDFSFNFSEYYPHTILNFAPKVDLGALITSREAHSAFIPLDVGWRKNMYTNVIAAVRCPQVDEVRVANFPNGLESLLDLTKMRLVGYKRGTELFREMADASVVVMATLAECQPMTALEAMAVGTPSVSGPLLMKEFEDDPLTKLTEVVGLDNASSVSSVVGNVLDVGKNSPSELLEMIASHLEDRHSLAFDRYADFLELS